MLDKLIKKNIRKKSLSKPVVLWWGRHDSGYSRNRMIWSLFESLGWHNTEFRPLSSDFGYLDSVLRNITRPDLVWVASFRHRDAVHAYMRAQRWRVPVIFDPLISSYEKDVFERKKWPEGHRNAASAKNIEKKIFSRADMIVADTDAHAGFFMNELGTDRRKTRVLYVGAEDQFSPAPSAISVSGNQSGRKPEILFYGSFLELHGVDVIVRAARMSSHINADWVLLGDGPCHNGLKKIAEGAENIFFEEPVPYSVLPSRMAKADIVLGVFGGTKKSDLVIPNKIFQAMAMGKPVITQKASAYPETLRNSDVIGWTEPCSPESLSVIAGKWLDKCGELTELSIRGTKTRELYETFFSRSILEKQLADIIKTAFSNKSRGI